METIKVKDKAIKELAKCMNEKIQAASEVIEVAGTLRKNALDKLFNTIKSEYPETKDYALSYNHKTDEISLLYKEDIK